jgi:cysteinyl-tRNA synthetase
MLRLYNSLTRHKDEFEPLDPPFTGVYVCGPTVYDHSHLGHGKSYVSFDVLVRYLRYLGYRVRYVQNITDVGHHVGDVDYGEDKVQKQASPSSWPRSTPGRTGRTWTPWEISGPISPRGRRDTSPSRSSW